MKHFIVFWSLIILPIHLIGQTLTSVSPPAQRVHDYIELEGSNFGNSQGNSLVRFTNGTDTWDAGLAYVWRDNYIKIRVPVGKHVGSTSIPISKETLQLFVQTNVGTSATLSFQVITKDTGTLEYRQLTNIVDDQDVSAVLGSPNLNYARSKDADLADVNGDGFMDIFDNNSSNVQNNSHAVLHINNRDKTFTAIKLEPRESGESGTFATTNSNGDFLENETSYDADMFDINNDRLPDILQTASKNPLPASGGNPRIRFLISNAGAPGTFSEETEVRLALGNLGTVGCPDDIDHADVNNDGWLDFLVTMRTAPGHCPGNTSITQVFINDGSGNYGTPQSLSAPENVSTHDAFFMDANDDGFIDIVLCNEFPFNTAFSQIFLHNGTTSSTPYVADALLSFDATSSADASAGAAADFNGDGLIDFVLAHQNVHLFLNDPDNPGDFINIPDIAGYDASKPNNPTVLPAGSGSPFYYDIELGDIDLDGDIDIVAASLQPNTDSNIQVWLNNGDGTFVNRTATSSLDLFPDNKAYQWLSSDLLDLDNDGDLDLYITGADGTGVGPDPGFGKIPNLLFENTLIGLDIVFPKSGTPAYAGSATGGRKVLINIRADLVIEDVLPSDFIIKVDNVELDPSAIVTGSQIEQEYWLLVQMPAKADGLYALEVVLADDPLISDLELEALEYTEERLFDRSLAIDRTTSMLYNSVTEVFETEKMDAAKAAANFFVNLSEDNDKIAVTSFKRNLDDGDGVIEQNEMARTDWIMTDGFDTSTSTNNRDLAIDVINNLQPDGTYFPYQTTIGAGLFEALNEVQDEGNSDHEYEIVLLSDGIENLAPFWEKVEAGPPIVLPIRPDLLGADPNVRVHTVAVGQDADALLLMDIADDTGGQFFNMYEGTASYGLISRLASVYKYIDEEMRGEQRFHYKEGIPDAITIESSPFSSQSIAVSHRKTIRLDSLYVPQGFESVSLGFHWNEKNSVEQINLYDSNLTMVAANPPVRTIQNDPSHKIYKIRDPQPGWYYYTVDLATTETFEFMVIGSGITDLLAIGKKGSIKETSPGFYEIPLRVIVGDSKPVLFCDISGEIVLPDKSHVSISLKDDGAHKDGRNADAIYGELFKHSMPGGYFASLTVTGISSLNEPFTRHLYLSWYFPGIESDPDEPDETDNPNDGITWPGGGEKKSLVWGFHVGSSHPLGKFNDYADANIHLRVDATYPIRPNLNAVLMAGFSQFTSDFASGRDNVWWSNVSVNAQAYTNMSNNWFTYLQAGAGYYWQKSGSASNVGANIGVGGIIPLASRPFSIRFGVDYHRVFNDNGIDYSTAQLGIMWRIKTSNKKSVNKL